MRPFMSGDLSSESEAQRANTPAWHSPLTGSTFTFSEEPCQEGFGGMCVWGGCQWSHRHASLAGVVGYLEVVLWHRK